VEVLDIAAVPGRGGRSPRPVCVLLRPDADRLGDAARWVGVDALVAERLPEFAHRPLAQLDGGQLSLVVFAVLDSGPPLAVQLHVGGVGLIVLCPDLAAPVVRRAVSPVIDSPADALAAVLLALAVLSEEAAYRLTETALALDGSATGVTSGSRRRAISQARVRLFSLQQLWTAQARVLDLADGIAEVLPETALSGVRRAGRTFDWSGTSAGQLYALLGDTLSRQATVVSERLTLVAVVFFPLTVSTGFFGMNFGWLTTRIGSAAAFLLLGVVMPCVLVAATLVGARWLTRD
jgi:CorA-like Mg2+ transporter protein